MAGETNITVTGNLTGDPELRTLPSGATVVSFTIASTARNYNRQTGQWENGDTLFLNCSAWNQPSGTFANNIAQSLSKGMRVVAQGTLRQRSYQTRDGQNRTIVEMRVSDIGPSLLRATASVNRQTRDGSGNANYGGFAPSGGTYTGGSTPAADPWSAPANENASFGSFGSNDEFGSEDMPEF